MSREYRTPESFEQSARLSPLAVASFILGIGMVACYSAGLGLSGTSRVSLMSLAPALGVLAVLFGHLARGQIRMRGNRGKGLALGGLVLGYGLIALFALNLAIRDEVFRILFVFIAGIVFGLVVRKLFVGSSPRPLDEHASGDPAGAETRLDRD
ncbi:DUF4190 domain-containing protein [Phytoactinopolyspora limicola]|uniref:DUF4190 domain-containing protein n=1 Tax=Phytoactinopolyspora limicola TaxID=2715536 RepID=UPI001407CD4F|nr:DUF4190 domain-containing protein [Phytoactinopolyspora limicola]